MKRHLVPFAPLVVLFVSAAVWAQEVSNPQVPPPPPTGPVPLPAPMVSPPATPYPPPPSTPYAPYAPPAGPYAPPMGPYGPSPPYAPPPLVVPPLEQPRWIVGVDALWLERSTSSSIRLGSSIYNGSLLVDDLYSDDRYVPLEGGVRFQVAGWMNDRSAIEASYWGLQQWSVGRTIYGASDDSVMIYTPWLQIAAPNLNDGLNNSLGYTYESRVDNAEINQRIRLTDYNPWWNWSCLWGIRYFRLSDNFTLSGSDTDFGDYENLNYQTANNLVGPQVGLQWMRGWQRFQFSTEAKVGLCANFYTQHGVDSGTGGLTPFDVSHSGTDFAALFELSLLARFRMTQALWLRLGYQYYCATGLAVGPRQLAGWDRNGTVALDGLSLGVEAAW